MNDLRPEDCRSAAATLRAVVDVIDAGTVEAEPVQRAYLVGAADALETLIGNEPEESAP